jgi:hypothetical protein
MSLLSLTDSNSTPNLALLSQLIPSLVSFAVCFLGFSLTIPLQPSRMSRLLEYCQVYATVPVGPNYETVPVGPNYETFLLLLLRGCVGLRPGNRLWCSSNPPLIL